MIKIKRMVEKGESIEKEAASIKRAIRLQYIRNNLSNNKDDEDPEEDEEDEKRDHISFLEVFVYCYFILNNDQLTKLFLEIIVETQQRQSATVSLSDLLRKRVSIHGLQSLHEFLVPGCQYCHDPECPYKTNHEVEDEELLEQDAEILNLSSRRFKDDVYVQSLRFFLNRYYYDILNPAAAAPTTVATPTPTTEEIERIETLLSMNESDIQAIETMEVVEFVRDIYHLPATIKHKYLTALEQAYLSGTIMKITYMFHITIFLRYIGVHLLIRFDHINKNYYYFKSRRESNRVDLTPEEYYQMAINYVRGFDRENQGFIRRFLQYYHNDICPDILQLKEEIRETKNECHICLDTLDESAISPTPQSVIVCMGCRNGFHEKCFIEWSKSDIQKRCPICRRSIYTSCIMNHDEKHSLYTYLRDHL